MVFASDLFEPKRISWEEQAWPSSKVFISTTCTLPGLNLLLSAVVPGLSWLFLRFHQNLFLRLGFVQFEWPSIHQASILNQTNFNKVRTVFFQSNWSHYNLVTRFKDHIQNKRFSGCSFIQSTTNGCFLLQQLYGFCWPAGHTICPTSTVSL